MRRAWPSCSGRHGARAGRPAERRATRRHGRQARLWHQECARATCPRRGPVATGQRGRPTVRTSQQPASAGEARNARLAAGPAPPRRPPRPRGLVPLGHVMAPLARHASPAVGCCACGRAGLPQRRAPTSERPDLHHGARKKYEKKATTPLRRDMTARTHRWSPRVPRWPAVARAPLQPEVLPQQKPVAVETKKKRQRQ